MKKDNYDDGGVDGIGLIYNVYWDVLILGKFVDNIHVKDRIITDYKSEKKNITWEIK